MSSQALSYRLARYLWERFNPPLMAAVSLVFTADLLSGSAMFLFMLQLRLQDEFKDFSHDKKYYPLRPVPRGLVTLSELAIVWGYVIFLETVISFFQGSWLWFFILQVYAVLIFREFWAKKFLSRHFSLNIFLHELSVLPFFLYLFSLRGYFGLIPSSRQVIAALFLGLNFFVLEIARKVRPQSQLVGRDTYLERYGFSGTLLLSWLVVSLAAAIGHNQNPRSGIFPISFLGFTALVVWLGRLPQSHLGRVRGLQLVLLSAVILLLTGFYVDLR